MTMMIVLLVVMAFIILWQRVKILDLKWELNEDHILADAAVQEYQDMIDRKDSAIRNLVHVIRELEKNSNENENKT